MTVKCSYRPKPFGLDSPGLLLNSLQHVKESGANKLHTVYIQLRQKYIGLHK